MFKKILIANRGEIACRLSDACRALGVQTVAVYSDADKDARHVRHADEAVSLGGLAPKDSYLRSDLILDAAKKTGAEAIHPGYGFLSEKAHFARACAEAGIVFIGPSPDSIERMGDKAEARRTVQVAGVPVVPGTQGTVESEEAAKAAAREIGFPVLVKASAGGGGIGMQVARNEEDLVKALRTCADRAKAAFGDPGVYIEKYFENPRHIEVQVLGDGTGKVLHLFERECSIQRRHQKVVEEAPSALFVDGQNAELAERLYSAAVRAAAAVKYRNAGTIEMLVADGSFYFIEMNTRLQVEHPVTEKTTGVNLIEWQLRIAAGEPLTLTQSEIRRSGHAIELRLYAEDPAKMYAPSPGTISACFLELEQTRLDAGYEAGGVVTPYYDPLVAKLVVWDSTRGACTDRALLALDRLQLSGLKPNGQPMAFNTELHKRILRSEGFRSGQLDTKFLERLKA
jgi:acetyl-CoA carboxylase biotin carboxylase subunit